MHKSGRVVGRPLTRVDLDASGLRLAARRSSSVAASRRMLALALVLEGKSRTEAAAGSGHGSADTARPSSGSGGCIATMRKAWPGCRIGMEISDQSACFPLSRKPRLRNGFVLALTWPNMASSAGAGPTLPRDQGQVRHRSGRTHDEHRAASAGFPTRRPQTAPPRP